VLLELILKLFTMAKIRRSRGRNAMRRNAEEKCNCQGNANGNRQW